MWYKPHGKIRAHTFSDCTDCDCVRGEASANKITTNSPKWNPNPNPELNHLLISNLISGFNSDSRHINTRSAHTIQNNNLQIKIQNLSLSLSQRETNTKKQINKNFFLLKIRRWLRLSSKLTNPSNSFYAFTILYRITDATAFDPLLCLMFYQSRRTKPVTACGARRHRRRRRLVWSDW